MINISIDKKAKKILVSTDYPFIEFKCEKHREHFHLNFKKNELESMGCSMSFSQFGGRKYYPNIVETVKIDSAQKSIELSYS